MYLWQGGLDGQTQECGGLDSCRFSSGCHSGLCHSLASCSVDWALLPLSTSKDYKASNKVRKRSHCKTSWSWDWNLLVACRCIACLRNSSDTHAWRHRRADVLDALSPMLFDAEWWGLGLLHFVYAGHYPPSNYGPTCPSLGVPDLTTLVDSLLHQMHLMPLT